MSSDLYRELGLSPDASQAEIEAAGRRAAKQHHPDKGGDRDRFDATMRALTVLRDPAKRETYDRTGQTSEEPAGLAEAEGMNLITARLTQILQNPGINLERMDVVGEITRAIQAQKREALSNIAETEKAITRLAKGRDRIKKKTGGENMLSRAVDGQIAGLRQGIGLVRQAVGAIDCALAILADYQYEVSGPPEAHAPGHPTLTASVLNQMFRDL